MKKLFNILILSIILSQIIIASPIIAANDPQGGICQICQTAPQSNECQICQQSAAKTNSTVLENPLGNVNSVSQLYGRIIYAFLGLSGAVALVMFILGGFSWMTAGGNDEKVKKGKDTLLWATLGLIIIFSSYAVLKTIFETLNFK